MQRRKGTSVHKVLIRILSSLKVSFSSTKVRRIVETKVVVSQGRLDDRGGARVVREVRVGGVDQGGPVHENLSKGVRAQVIYERPLQTQRRGNSTTIARRALLV